MPTVGLVLYPRYTALDIVGPYEVFAALTRLRPDYRLLWLAETAEPVRADRGATLVPDGTFAEAPGLEVVIVPGGPGQLAQMENEALVGFLRSAGARAEHVASVCTGSLLLARAGFLGGKRATTHWLAREALAALGARVTGERVVRDGNVWTAAGVSAGIDLALALVAEREGSEAAQAVQLGIEYDPRPPFDAGSPEKAPPAIVEAMRAGARAFL